VPGNARRNSLAAGSDQVRPPFEGRRSQRRLAHRPLKPTRAAGRDPRIKVSQRLWLPVRARCNTAAPARRPSTQAHTGSNARSVPEHGAHPLTGRAQRYGRTCYSRHTYTAAPHRSTESRATYSAPARALGSAFVLGSGVIRRRTAHVCRAAHVCRSARACGTAVNTRVRRSGGTES